MLILRIWDSLHSKVNMVSPILLFVVSYLFSRFPYFLASLNVVLGTLEFIPNLIINSDGQDYFLLIAHPITEYRLPIVFELR